MSIYVIKIEFLDPKCSYCFLIGTYHTGNRLDAYVVGRIRLNHIGTRCAILTHHTNSVVMI